MNKKVHELFDQLDDDLSLSQIKQAVGGIRHVGTADDGDTALEHALTPHAATDPHVADPVHSHPPVGTVDDHHLLLTEFLGHSGHDHESAGKHFAQAFDQTTNYIDPSTVNSDVALGQAISNHISKGHHPLTFNWPGDGTFASIPLEHGPVVTPPHLVDHNAPPKPASRARAEGPPNARENTSAHDT